MGRLTQILTAEDLSNLSKAELRRMKKLLMREQQNLGRSAKELQKAIDLLDKRIAKLGSSR